MGDSMSDEDESIDPEKEESVGESSGEDEEGESRDENDPNKKKKKKAKKGSDSKLDGKTTPDEMLDEEGSDGEKKSRRAANRMEED